MIDAVMRSTLHHGNNAFTLDIALKSDASRLVLFGASGSGKTLTLQMLAGLLRPDAGRIVLRGHCVFDSAAGVDLPPHQRRIGYLFQQYALFPHMNLRENLSFALESSQTSSGLFRSRKRHSTEIEEMLERFEIAHLADRLPSQLSGGQKQRGALARALITKPRMLFLDEPFAALDPLLRLRLRRSMDAMLREYDIPLIMITHDPVDVETFAEDLAIYSNGRIVHTERDFRSRLLFAEDTLTYLSDFVENEEYRPVGFDDV